MAAVFAANAPPKPLLPTPPLSLPTRTRTPKSPTTSLTPLKAQLPSFSSSSSVPLQSQASGPSQTPNTPSSSSSSFSSTSLDQISSEVRRLCLQGNLQQALHHLSSLGPKTTLEEDAYVALIQLCERKRAREEGSRVCAHVFSFNTHLSTSLGNALLSLFVRVGNLHEAWVVFGRMVERDVFSWNIMVGGYAKTGFFDEAMDFYSRMIWTGVRPDIYTFPCVLRACAAALDLFGGREVHVHVIRFGLIHEVDVLNALITMYAKCGDVISARRLFDGMDKRDLVSWNAMISGYFENDLYLDGLELFLIMRKVSIDPDFMTLTSVISGSELMGRKEFGKQVHAYVIKTDLADNVAVQNSLIQMYSYFGDLDMAEKIFSLTESKDLVSWTTMISGYVKNGLSDDALKVYSQMRADDVVPDEVAITSVLSACTSLGRTDIGIELHELAKSLGLLTVIVMNALIDMYAKSGHIESALRIFKNISRKDIISWSSIILGLKINGRSSEALTFFRKMQKYLIPNPTSLIAALSACADIGALMCGKEIHGFAVRSGYGFQGYLPNAILDFYVKCGRTNYALTLFSIHEEKDVTTWNTMLTGCARSGNGVEAVALFQHMEDLRVTPNEITFVCLLGAFGRSGMVSEAWKYFNCMITKYNITPNLKHYACMVDMLGRAGLLDEAYKFVEGMPIEPDAAVWGALLNACRIHRHVTLGEIAAKRIFELDSVSIGYYLLLCNLYTDAGCWNDLKRVRKMMRDQGLAFDPGCTWVESKGEVHAFLSSDESHPQTKQIHAVLNGLYDRMDTMGLSAPDDGFITEVEASKADIFCGHSERTAVVFALINSVPGSPILATKNLSMCRNCHHTIKSISMIVRREITVRDTERFHHFKDGQCSCGDKGYVR